MFCSLHFYTVHYFSIAFITYCVHYFLKARSLLHFECSLLFFECSLLLAKRSLHYILSVHYLFESFITSSKIFITFRKTCSLLSRSLHYQIRSLLIQPVHYIFRSLHFFSRVHYIICSLLIVPVHYFLEIWLSGHCLYLWGFLDRLSYTNGVLSIVDRIPMGFHGSTIVYQWCFADCWDRQSYTSGVLPIVDRTVMGFHGSTIVYQWCLADC